MRRSAPRAGTGRTSRRTARARVSGRARGGRGTHECDVNDQVLRREERVGRAPARRVVRHGRAQRRRVHARRVVLQPRRHRRALCPPSAGVVVKHGGGARAHGEEPDRDALLRKLGDEHAAAGLRERCAVALRARVRDDAPLVRVRVERAVRRVHEARLRRVRRVKVAALPARQQAESVRRGGGGRTGSVCRAIWFMVTWFTPSNVSISPPCGQSCAWLHHAGHTLHAQRGVRRMHPRRACSPAAEGHVRHVGDPEAADGVRVRGRDAHGVALLVERHGGGVVDLDDGVAGAVDECELCGLRNGLRDEDGVAVGEVVDCARGVWVRGGWGGGGTYSCCRIASGRRRRVQCVRG